MFIKMITPYNTKKLYGVIHYGFNNIIDLSWMMAGYWSLRQLSFEDLKQHS
jgi:hypothetical protein